MLKSKNICLTLAYYIVRRLFNYVYLTISFTTLPCATHGLHTSKRSEIVENGISVILVLGFK